MSKRKLTKDNIKEWLDSKKELHDGKGYAEIEHYTLVGLGPVKLAEKCHINRHTASNYINIILEGTEIKSER